MPLWGIFALGAGALLAGWLLGTQRVEQELAEKGLVDLARDWDSYSPAAQDRIAGDLVSSLVDSKDKAGMLKMASFLSDMNRPAESMKLRDEAAKLS